MIEWKRVVVRPDASLQKATRRRCGLFVLTDLCRRFTALTHVSSFTVLKFSGSTVSLPNSNVFFTNTDPVPDLTSV